MKLSILAETDDELRRLERTSREDPIARQLFKHRLKRAGRTPDRISRSVPLPNNLLNKPDQLLKFHRDNFGGAAWPELENHILNSKQVESLRRGRVGDMTFPTLTVVKYALQLEDEWPEFLNIAQLMLNFMDPPTNSNIGSAARGSHRLGGSYSRPMRVNRVSSGLIMIAQYLIKHQLAPEWAHKLYQILLYAQKLQLANREVMSNPETGEVNIAYTIDGKPLETPPGIFMNDDFFHINFARSIGTEEDLSRVVGGLRKLLGL